MREVEELLKSLVTVDEGLKIISNLEKKPAVSQKVGKKTVSGSSRLILDEFKTAFYKMQVVSLTLAITPSRDFLIELQQWFSDNLADKVIFDLNVDPQIIGGVTIICRDHFRDFSLAATIERTAKNGEEFKELEPDIVPTVTI